MKRRLIFSLGVVCALWLVSALPVDAVPVFSDDFSTSALLAEKWKLAPAADWQVVDGCLTVAGGKTASATPLGVSLDGPVVLTCRVRVSDFDNKGGWAGVGVRGVLFTLKPGSYWHVYRIAAQTRSLGGLRSDRAPERGRWHAMRIEQEGDCYRWFVDGEKIVEFREPNRIEGGDRLFSLATSGPGISYDDVAVGPLTGVGAVSANYLRNASFEQVPDHVPTYWKPGGSLPPETFWPTWGVVSNESWHGLLSLRIVSKGSGNGFSSHQNGMPVGTPCTYSVHLKSDRPALKARLTYWEYPSGRGRNLPITVGTAWMRHSFTVDSPSNTNVRIGVQIPAGESGTLWADAAQLEVGTNVTPFALASIDSATGSVAEASIPAPRTLAVSSQPPVLDGRLDDPVWNDGSRAWPLRLPGGLEARERTEAYLLLAADTLFIGMRCHDSDLANLKAKETRHDGQVYLDDCVEILLDTRRDRMSYYHLAVNAIGTRFDAGPGRDSAWNQDWEARTFRGDTYWSTEIALPLASFGPSPALATNWGVNLCRANHKAGEWSSTALPRSANFHCPALYPELIWPAEAFKTGSVVPEELEAILLPDGQMRFSGQLANRSGRALKVVVASTETNAPWLSGVVDLPVDGRTAFAVALPPPAAGSVEWRVSGVVRAGEAAGRPLHAFSALLPVGRPLEGLLERSFYTDDLEARFLAQIKLPAERLAECRLTWSLDGTPVGVATGAQLRAFMPLAIPLSQVPAGKHALAVALTGGGGVEIAAAQATLEKLPSARSVVPVDRMRRCLVVDDQPFFVFAPLFQIFAHQKPDDIDRVINHYADAGFRSIMIVGKSSPEWAAAKWARYFQRAADRGMKVIAWPGGFFNEANQLFDPFIARWKDHPSLIAWLPVDEPELYATAEATEATIRHFQQQDPYHPVYANNTIMGIPSRFAGLPGDLISIDDYLTNREDRRVDEIVRQVAVMEQAARPTRRPCWIFLVGNNLHNHSREPTPGEQVAQTYGSALAGASGLIYFMGYPADRRHWQMLRQLNQEFLALGPVLLSPEPAPVATCSSSALRYGMRRVGSDVYLIAVNLEDQPADVTFTVAGMDDGDAVVLFEDRAVAFTDGVLKARFAPHERHVYRFTLAE